MAHTLRPINSLSVRKFASGENYTEMKESRPYRFVKVEVRFLNRLLALYVVDCDKDELLRHGHKPEIKIVRNLVSRYLERMGESLDEKDVELLVNVVQMNINERTHRSGYELHDAFIDTIIDTFELTEFVQRRVYFVTPPTQREIMTHV